MSDDVKPDQKPPEEITDQPKTTSSPSIMTADEEGVLVPKDVNEAFRYAAMIHKSGLAPASFDSPEKVLVAMQLARELDLKPMVALRSMYVVNGTPNLWGDLPLALVRRSGLLELFEEHQYDEQGRDMDTDPEAGHECFKAVCIVKRVGMATVQKSITWPEVQAAGLHLNKWGAKDTYKNFRKRMMQMRVRTVSLKDQFGDVLQGIAIMEYDGVQQKEKTVSANAVDRLNAKYNLQVERDITPQEEG